MSSSWFWRMKPGRPLSICCTGCADADSGRTPITRRKPKGQMKQASRLGARYAVVIGEDELAAGAATVRDMASGEQGRLRSPAWRSTLFSGCKC